jgi:hypothetical protein
MTYFRINGQDYTLIETKWKNDITNDVEIMKYIMKIYKYMKTTLNQKGKSELTGLENRLFTQLKGSDFMRVKQKTQRKNGPASDTGITREVNVTDLLRKMNKVLDGIRSMVATVNENKNRTYRSYSIPYRDNPIPSIKILLQRFFNGTNPNTGGDISENPKTLTDWLSYTITEYEIRGTPYDDKDSAAADNSNFVNCISSVVPPLENGPKNIIELFKQIGETLDDDNYKQRKRVLVNYFIALFEDLTFLGQENNDNYSFFASKVPLLTSLYALVKQIKDERHFSEDYIKNMMIIDTTEGSGDKKLFDSAPKEYRDFVTELNAIAGTLRLSNQELQKMMVEFARGKSTVSLMIPFLGFLIDENYIRDDDDLVKKVRAGNDAVFDANIFNSRGKNTTMFERCVKSGYKMDAANNVVIDVYVDLIFGKIASGDLPMCKIRDAILGVRWFGDKGTLDQDNKFLDERLDPYLGADPDEAQKQLQKQAQAAQAQAAQAQAAQAQAAQAQAAQAQAAQAQAAQAQAAQAQAAQAQAAQAQKQVQAAQAQKQVQTAQAAGQSRRIKKRPTRTRTRTRRQRRNKENNVK